MPNPLIYASTTPNHSLHKGGVAVGVNSVEYNPSNGWVNGAIPTDWDYVIYKTTSGANPNIFAPANEQEFYNFVLMQGGSASDTTSVGAALAWIATQSDLLALHSSLPNIVTDGLVLDLNAGQVSSYPTTGTTWYDLSGQGHNGTLTNGPTFNSEGAIVFDGVDDRINIINPGISQQFSVSSWVYCTNVASSNNIVSKNGPYFMRIVSSKVRFNVLAGSWLFQNGTTILTNDTWYNLAMVYDGSTWKGYINGEQEFSTSKTGTITSNAPLYIGYTPAGGEQAGFNGNIARVSIYDKALTPTEILQNYYQAPIVTDGLVRALDFSNLVSYESGSSSGYDLTGNDTFDLINDPIYTSDFGGGLICDATDDFIVLGDVTATDYVSAECWFRNDINDSSENIIFNKESSWEVKEQNGILQWALLASNRSWFWSNANVSVGEGEMCHIVLTYDGNYVKFYFNGVETVSYTYPSGGVLASQTSCYPKLNSRGCTRTSPSSLGNKTYFQFRVYDRALTAAEVQQNFQAQSSRFI